jgi:hypothetical protein
VVESTTQRVAHDLQNAADSHSDGHKTAQEVQGVQHTGSDIASVLGGSSGNPDHGGFADLIRAAQNPVQAGLVTAAPPAVHPDLHLALNGVTGHDFSVPDLHTATATVEVHDVHVDQHAIAAPALDHHVEVVHH